MSRQIKPFMMAVLLLAMTLVPTVLLASEDWGDHCYRMMPFLDILTLDLTRPNPPKWNLNAQAEWNGDSVYALPGGGDLHTDLDEAIYTLHLTLHNTSTFFAGQPIVSVRGILGGPWTLEARGKVGVAPFVVHGTLTVIPNCSISASIQGLSVSEQGSGLAGAAPQ